jgi:hypothetical protein
MTLIVAYASRLGELTLCVFYETLEIKEYLCNF